MKKFYLLCLAVSGILLLSAMPTAKSILFADSYMLRSSGVEAAYWNPARLSENRHTDLWLPGLNSAVMVSNNALDLDTYNYFVSCDTLHVVDKERLLQDVKGMLSLASEGSASIFGFTMGNTALSASGRVYVKGHIAEDILRLALYGNTEDSYYFDKATVNASAMAYSDLSYSAGGFDLPFLPPSIPAIKAGFSVSALVGMSNLETRKFQASFSTDADSGTNVQQEMILRTSTYGLGYKVMLGLYSKVLPKLETGITLDNIAGRIRWLGDNEERYYHIAIDSLYASNIEEDFYEQTDEIIEIDSYSTSLPPELRLAAKYDLGFMDVSADWVQGFKESTVTRATGRLSCAAGFKPLPFLPLSFGISFPNSTLPLKTSYSIGISSRMQEFAIGIQSYNSIIPGYKSKGVSLATSMRFWF